MHIDVSVVSGEETLALRDLYRREMNCQIVLDSWHGRGWTDSYLIRLDGRVVGYGLVGGVRAERKEIHYNVPYGDIFMAVAEPLRRRGYGGYLIQELKRVCYEMGRV